MSSLASLGITPEAIRGYDQRIPRYTSYPTAPYWTEQFGPADWLAHLDRTSPESGDLSLYAHIPFCGKRCKFCACNVIITRQEGIAGKYLDVLEKEVALIRGHWRGTGKVIQLHLGGGTPNYLTSDEMARLTAILENAFPFADAAERSIEIDPRVATPAEVRELAQRHKFKRISFGVQDFHPDTQEAIGREQTEECTFANVAAARESGFESINIDMIYGLPRQTAESWRRSIQTVVDLRPDRIALYNFAYLPGRLAHQRTFENEQMPSPSEKLELFMAAHDRLTAEGWEFIGMDHYALKNDSLAGAQRAGTLRRNFMGYTTLRGTDMLSFGTSAISEFQGAFAQNVKKLSQYNEMIGSGIAPIERGLPLTPDDRLRQYIIEELMCNSLLAFDGPWGEQAAALTREETPALLPLQADGLIELHPDRIIVTQKGRMFLRNIAVVFDAWVGRGAQKPMFSRAV